MTSPFGDEVRDIRHEFEHTHIIKLHHELKRARVEESHPLKRWTHYQTRYWPWACPVEASRYRRRRREAMWLCG
jgi:hypothetical protein